MLEGRTADARARYAEALRLCRELHIDYWLGMTILDIAMTGALEAEERRSVIEEGRAVFTRLRATALLDLLDAAAGEPDRPTRSMGATASAAAAAEGQAVRDA
jgi:hypothetical protein